MTKGWHKDKRRRKTNNVNKNQSLHINVISRHRHAHKKEVRIWVMEALPSSHPVMQSLLIPNPDNTVTCHQKTAPPLLPRPLTCGVSSECLGTRSYETTSRDQRGKIEMFFSSTGACIATKSPIANHRSPIIAQLYFASVTQMFLMPLFVKVESDSSKLLRIVSKSGPNGCKERSKQQKMLMRI